MEAPAVHCFGGPDAEADIARTIAFVVEARRGERHLAGPGAGCLRGAGQDAVVAAQHLEAQGVAGLRRLGQSVIDSGTGLEVHAVGMPGDIRGDGSGGDDIILKDQDGPVGRLRLSGGIGTVHRVHRAEACRGPASHLSRVGHLQSALVLGLVLVPAVTVEIRGE